MTTEEKVYVLIRHLGYDLYCEMALKKYKFPFKWSLSDSGEVEINPSDGKEYLKKELAKGLNPDEIIKRDKEIQDDAVSLFYKEFGEYKDLFDKVALKKWEKEYLEAEKEKQKEWTERSKSLRTILDSFRDRE